MEAKIDRKLNIVLPINTDEGEVIYMFINQPSKIMFESVTKVLQKFYTLATKDISVDIIVRDYEQFIEEAIQSLPDRDQYFTNIKSFLEKTLYGSNVFVPSKCEFIPYIEFEKSISEDSRSMIEGTLVFISALYRYTSLQAKTTVLKDYFTSMNYSEWTKHCENLFKDLQKDKSSVKNG